MLRQPFGRVFGELIRLALLIFLFFMVYHDYFRGSAAVPLHVDAIQEFWPQASFAGRHMARGEMPLWDCTSFCGSPHGALGYVGVFYPVSLLFGLVSSVTAMKLELLGHVFVYGVLGYFMGRVLFRLRTTAVFVAVGLFGLMALEVTHGTLWLPRHITFVPLAWLSLAKLLEEGRAKWFVMMSMALGVQIITGHSQLNLYLFMILGVWTMAELCRLRIVEKRSWSVLSKRGLQALGGVFTACCVGAIQLLPNAELVVYESGRQNAGSLEFISQFSVPWSYLGAMLLSRLGPVCVGLALISLFVGRDSRRWPFVITLALCLMYAAGSTMPGFGLVRFIPLLNTCRVPSRVLIPGAVLLPIVAAYGLEGLYDLIGKHRLTMPRWGGAVVIIALLAWPGLSTDSPDSVPQVFVIAGMVSALSLAHFLPRPRWFVTVLYPLACAGSLLAGLAVVKTEDSGAYTVNKDFAAFLNQREGIDRVALIAPDAFTLNWPAQGMGLLTDTRLLSGYNALPLNRYAAWMNGMLGYPYEERLDPMRVAKICQQDIADPGWIREENLIILDLLNVRYVLGFMRRVEAFEDEPALRERIPKTQIGELAVYENPSALPPAYLVHAVRTASSGEETIRILRSEGFDPRTEVVLNAPLDLPEAGDASLDRVAVREYDLCRVVIDVESDGDGVLVLTDTWYPGWRATLDAQTPLDVFCANGLVRGVRVPGGTHRVEFYFAPASVRVGMGISFAALTTALLWGIVVIRRGREYRRQDA